MCLKAEVYLSFFTSSLGCPDHASPAADPRTDRHVAPRAATEHPHPQRADSEDCRRSTLTVKLRGEKQVGQCFLVSIMSLQSLSMQEIH